MRAAHFLPAVLVLIVAVNCGTAVPRYVNGIDYPLTRNGAQQAIDECENGTVCDLVNIEGDIESDGITLMLKNGVDVDWHHHRLKMMPTDKSYINIAMAGILVDELFLSNDAERGSFTLNISGLSNATNLVAPYVVGDFILLREKGDGRQFISIIADIDLSTNSVTLIDSVADPFLVSNGAWIVHNPQVIRQGGLYNFVCDANGNNGNLSICLEFRPGAIHYVVENIQVTGSFGPRNKAGIQGLWFHRLYASRVLGVTASGFATSTSDYNDIQFHGLGGGTTVDHLVSLNANGFGPGFAHCQRITVSGVQVTHAGSRGFLIDRTTLSTFNGIVITDGTTSPATANQKGSGLCLRFGSHNNTISNVIVFNGDDFAIRFDGSQCKHGFDCDSFNTVTNVQLKRHRAKPGLPSYSIVNGRNCTGNTVEGSWDGLVQDWNKDFKFTNSRGPFVEQSISRTCPTADDFTGKWNVRTCIRCMPFDNVLKDCCFGLDGYVRCFETVLF